MRRLIPLIALLLLALSGAEARLPSVFNRHGGGSGSLAAPPNIAAITLTNTNFTAPASSGTVVGTIGVTMSSGSFTGTLSLSGPNADQFQIVGSQLQTLCANTNCTTAAGTYSINIVATQNGATCSINNCAQSENITGSAPSLVISSVNLSNTSFIGGSPTGTTIGNIAVTLSSGSFTGSLSLSGPNASNFQIAGTTLQTLGVDPVGTYSINIVASQNGASNSPLTAPFTISGTSSGQANGNCADGASAVGCVIIAPSTKTLIISSLGNARVGFDQANPGINGANYLDYANGSLQQVAINTGGGALTAAAGAVDMCCGYAGGLDGGGFGDAVMIGPSGTLFVRGYEKTWYQVIGPGNHTTIATTASPSYSTTTEPAWITKSAGDAAVNINIVAPTNNLYSAANLTHAVVNLPTNGTVLLSDGVTPVTAGQRLSQAQLTSLQFKPTTTALNVSQDSTFTYLTTDPAQQGALGTAGFTVLPSTALWADPAVTFNSNTTVLGAPVDFYPQILQPASAGDIVGMRFQNTTGSLQAAGSVMWGLVFRPGDVPTSGTALCMRLSGQACSIYVQMDAKEFWQDNSVRHAVLSANIPSIAANSSVDLLITRGSVSAPTAAPSAATVAAGAYDVNATITYQSGGIGTDSGAATSCKSILNDAIARGTLTQWLSGPVVNAWTAKPLPSGTSYVGTGAIAGGNARVQCDIYAFSDTTFQTDYIVDNTWAFVGGKSDLKYSISFSQDGFSQNPVYNPLYTPYWHPVTVGRIKPNIQYDVPYLIATRAVPNYDVTFGVAEASVNSDLGAGISSSINTYVPIMTGVNNANITTDWGAVGDRPDLAPLTKWSANWVQAQSANAWAVMMANAYTASAMPVYFRDEVTDLPVNIETWPTFLTLSSNFGPTKQLANGNPSIPAGCGGTCPNGTMNNVTGENAQAHRPDLLYLPYLMTGNHHFMELFAGFNNQAITLFNNAGTNQDVSGHYPAGAFASFMWNSGATGNGTPQSGIQPRHQSWDMRDVCRMAAFLPSTYGLKTYAKTECGKVYAEINNYAANGVGIADFRQQAGTVPALIGNTGGNVPPFETIYGYTALDPLVHMQIPTGSAAMGSLLRWGGTGFATGLVTSGQLGLPMFASTAKSYTPFTNACCGGNSITTINSSFLYPTLSQLANNNIAVGPDNGGPGFWTTPGQFLGNCRAMPPAGGGVQGGYPAIEMAGLANIISTAPDSAQTLHAYANLSLGLSQCFVVGSADLVSAYQQIVQFDVVPRLPDGSSLYYTNKRYDLTGSVPVACPGSPCAIGAVAETGQTYTLSSTNASGKDSMTVWAVGGSQYGSSGVGGGGGTGTMDAHLAGADQEMYGGCGAGTFITGSGNALIVPHENCWVGTGPAARANTIQAGTNLTSKTIQVGYARTVWGAGTTAGQFRPGTDILRIKSTLNGRGYASAADFTSHCSVSGNDTVCDLGNGSTLTVSGVTSSLTGSVVIF